MLFYLFVRLDCLLCALLTVVVLLRVLFDYLVYALVCFAAFRFAVVGLFCLRLIDCIRGGLLFDSY